MRNLKELIKEKAKNKIKGKLKKVAAVIGTKIGLIILIMLIPILIFTSILKVFTSKEFTKKITDSLLNGEDNIEKIISDVHIKDGKWYLSTEAELTERLTKCIEGTLDSTSRSLKFGDDLEYLKKFLYAEIATSRPSLDGDGKKDESVKVTQVDSLDNFLFVGDSYTEALKSTIEKNCKNSVVKAVIGVSASHWLNHFNEMPDSKNIKGVCLLIGVNGMDTTNDSYRNSQTESTKDLIKKLSEKYSDVPIYVQKVFPVGKNYSEQNPEKTNKCINEHNNTIQSYTTTLNNVNFIDTTEGFVGTDGYLTGTSDGLHINDNNKFYKNIASKIKGTIATTETEVDEDREALEQTSTDIKGAVKIKRRLADKKYDDVSESIISLKYVSEDTLKSETNWDKAKTYFSMNEDYSCVLVASKNIDESTGGFTIESIPYLEIVKPFTMHFEFLLTLNETLENPGFCLALADLVQNSEIHLTILDSQTTEVTKSYIDGKYESGANYHHDIKTESITTEYNYVTASITYADIWIMSQTKEPTYQYETSSDKVTTNLEDKVLEDGQKTVDRVKTVETSTETISWNEGTSKDNVDKVDDIIKMIKTRYAQPKTGVPKAAEGGIKSAPGLILDILDSLPRAENEAQIMRYIIYKLTGRDFGVTELDFSMFDAIEFGAMSGMTPLLDLIHEWESGTQGPKTTADGTKYIIEDDGSGRPCVGYGVDIIANYDKLKKRGCPYTLEYIKSNYRSGKLAIDKEIVDSVEQEEMDQISEYIRSKVAGLNLKEYQIQALISRAYNCGAGGAIQRRNGLTFMQAYKKYWNQERDDQFGQKENASMYKHSLYTNYMCKPTTGQGGKYLPGLERRRKGEWLLFKTGCYVNTGKFWSEEQSGGGGEASGDTFTVGGKTFIEYKQYNYKSRDVMVNPTGTWYTISEGGCMPTSVTIIASGYGVKIDGSIINPKSFVKKIWGSDRSYPEHAQRACKKIGLKASGNLSSNASAMLSALKSGKQLLVHAVRGSHYTTAGHYMAVLSVNGNKVYLSNPSKPKSNKSQTGWIDINQMLRWRCR